MRDDINEPVNISHDVLFNEVIIVTNRITLDKKRNFIKRLSYFNLSLFA